MPEPRFAAWRARVEATLDRVLPDPAASPARLHAAMRHGVLNGGKRMRPLLAYATGTAFGVDEDALDAAAAAVELVHCYSLVHDDLPAMDDDSLRRGRPTVHVAFDEATAILAGDALQALRRGLGVGQGGVQVLFGAFDPAGEQGLSRHRRPVRTVRICPAVPDR